MEARRARLDGEAGDCRWRGSGGQARLSSCKRYDNTAGARAWPGRRVCRRGVLGTRETARLHRETSATGWCK